MKRIVPFLLGFLIAIRVLSLIVVYRTYFTTRFDPQYYGDLYSQSQYVIGERSVGGIGDDGLYAFAGYYYLFKGGDVSSVNFEHPPLGKYLIGLSIFLFGNQNVINLLYFFLLLIITYKIAKLIRLGTIGSWFSILLVGIDPLFLDHLIRSQLDLPFTLFFTGAVYFFMKSFKAPRNFLYSNLLWGAAFSTRFFPVFIFIYIIELLFVVHTDSSTSGESSRPPPRCLRAFLYSSLAIPVIYMLTHIMFFVYHPSVTEFLRHKRWMLSWFSGTVIVVGNIWRTIVTGWYIDPTGFLRVSTHWWIVIPFTVVFAIISPLVKRFKNTLIVYVYLQIILYLFYLTFLTNGDLKFMMPIYPLLVVVAIRSLTELYSIIRVHATRGRSSPH